MTRPVQILELRQARCDLRFGVGTCTATGSPKCFQTFHTCGARDVYNTDGQLSWYFTRPGDPAPRTADLPSADEWHGPTIPILRTVKTNPARLNIGAARESEGPYGLRGEVSIALDDFEFRNQFGDFYASERTVRGSLGRLLLAWLGEAVPQLEMFLYTGVEGDALADMTARQYDVTNMDPPSNGQWTISGRDPLDRAGRKKATFPRATDITLATAINSSTTTIDVIGVEADISDAFGNTGATRYIRFGDEIVSYTGYTGTEPDWTLSGVIRGALATVADSHSVDAGGQRVGHYLDSPYWQAAYDVLLNHTTLTSDLFDYATGWTYEGTTYLSTMIGTGTWTSPTPVEDVTGEMMRDGMFSLWWDERSQLIKMLANRQPTSTPQEITERSNIVASAIQRTPGDRLTRVTINYGRGNPTLSIDEPGNYENVRARIDGTAELPSYADGSIRDQLIYSRMIRSDFNSILVGVLLLQRYVETPQYIDLTLAYKDADVQIGDVLNVTSYDVIDTLGNPLAKPWQVIEWEEVEPGAKYRVLGQSYTLFNRPSFIMANDAPDFATATDAEKINACFITENDGTMPDGSVGYVLQ